MQTFSPSQRVEIQEGSIVIDSAQVEAVGDHVITLVSEELQPGIRTQMVYLPGLEVWKVLFEGLGGERCINPRGKSYSIHLIT